MLRDIRYGLRLLSRTPAFAVAAILTLAVGIGATSTVYAVVFGLLLRPLPVHDEASLVIAYATEHGILDNAPISYPKYLEWRTSGIFEDVAVTTPAQVDLAGGAAERIVAAHVSTNFFTVLGVRPSHGRVFRDTDRHATQTPVVISDTLWRRRYQGNPAVLGSQLAAGDLRLTVIGVMPPGFERWRGDAQMWLPIEAGVSSARRASRNWLLFTAVARLRAGVPAGRAAVELNRIDVENDTRIEASSPGNSDGTGVRLVSLRDDVVPARVERLAGIALVAAVLAWMVVCANLATLLLARGAGRQPEMAVRRALGADRLRLVRQVLLECAGLIAPGGALGACLAWWAIRGLVANSPPGLFDLDAVRFDWHITVFVLGVSLASAVAFGALPALRLSTPLTSSLQPRSSRRTGRLAHALIAGQIAAAVLVMVGASLLVKSLVRIQQVPLGFAPAQVLALHLRLPSARYGNAVSVDDPRYYAAQRELLDRLHSIPHVEAVTFGPSIFIPNDESRSSIQLDDGRRFLNGSAADRPMAPGMHFIGPDYFNVHGAILVEGREFSGMDDLRAPRVVVVNETAARLYWPGQAAIGRRVNFGRRTRGSLDEPWASVIGVVRDIRHAGLEGVPRPHIYRSALQFPRQEFDVMMRTSVPPVRVAAAARDAVRRFDSDIPIVSTTALADVVNAATAATRYSAALLSLFAAVMTLLCAVGVYSVVSCAVASRRREFGIRVALGATPASLRAEMLRSGGRFVLAGVVAGMAFAAVTARVLDRVLFQVSPRDPYVFASAAAAVALVVVAAAYVPARRLSRIDPVLALRAE